MYIAASTENVTIAPAWTRPDAGLLDRFADFPAAAVGDALDRMTVLDGAVRLCTTAAGLRGFALPVDVRAGDNLAVHRALDDARPGDVLVVNSRGDTTRAVLGDLMGEIMTARGVTGAVVDGAVRDVDALSKQGIAVYARAVTPAGPSKNGPGSIGHPVAVGGVVVQAGDLLVGDEDGVVVVARDRIADVAELAQEVIGREESLRARIRDGG